MIHLKCEAKCVVNGLRTAAGKNHLCGREEFLSLNKKVVPWMFKLNKKKTVLVATVSFQSPNQSARSIFKNNHRHKPKSCTLTFSTKSIRYHSGAIHLNEWHVIWRFLLKYNKKVVPCDCTVFWQTVGIQFSTSHVKWVWTRNFHLISWIIFTSHWNIWSCHCLGNFLSIFQLHTIIWESKWF